MYINIVPVVYFNNTHVIPHTQISIGHAHEHVHNYVARSYINAGVKLIRLLHQLHYRSTNIERELILLKLI